MREGAENTRRFGALITSMCSDDRQESSLMIPSVAHGTVSSTPCQNVWPFGGPTRRRQTGGPVAHSREAPLTRCRLKPIHTRHPVAWRLYRPRTEPGRQLRIPLGPSPSTRPLPVLRPPHQLRPQRIALHIARDRQEMLVGLYRKRFEATLIDRPGPRRVMVRMPSLGMGDGHPPQHLRQLAITSRPEQEVPVMGIKQ